MVLSFKFLNSNAGCTGCPAVGGAASGASAPSFLASLACFFAAVKPVKQLN